MRELGDFFFFHISLPPNSFKLFCRPTQWKPWILFQSCDHDDHKSKRNAARAEFYFIDHKWFLESFHPLQLPCFNFDPAQESNIRFEILDINAEYVLQYLHNIRMMYKQIKYMYRTNYEETQLLGCIALMVRKQEKAGWCCFAQNRRFAKLKYRLRGFKDIIWDGYKAAANQTLRRKVSCPILITSGSRSLNEMVSVGFFTKEGLLSASKAAILGKCGFITGPRDQAILRHPIANFILILFISILIGWS